MRNHLAIAAILAVLVVPSVRGTASAAPPAGEVLALFGQCFVETGGRRTLLKLGDPVHIGDTVDVAAGAKLKLRMNDGSVIDEPIGRAHRGYAGRGVNLEMRRAL